MLCLIYFAMNKKAWNIKNLLTSFLSQAFFFNLIRKFLANIIYFPNKMLYQYCATPNMQIIMDREPIIEGFDLPNKYMRKYTEDSYLLRK